MSRRARAVAAVVVLVAVTLAIYLPALWTNGFIYEDPYNFIDGMIRERHMASLGMHIVTGLLVYRLAVLCGIRNAWIAGAVVLWHPIQTEAVCYAAMLPAMEVVCEVALACVVAVPLVRSLSLWRIAIVLALAWQANETYQIGALCLPLVGCVVLSQARPGWLKRVPWSIWILGAIGSLVCGVVITWRILPSLMHLWTDDSIGRVAWMGVVVRALAIHAWHFVFPLGDQWAVVHEALARPVSGVWLMIDGLAILGILWRLRHTQAVWWLLWLLVVLAPRFVFREVREPLSEHHLYLAVIGVAMLLAMACGKVCGNPVENLRIDTKG